MKNLIAILIGLIFVSTSAFAASYYFSYQNDNFGVSYHKYEPYEHSRYTGYYVDSYTPYQHFYAPITTVHYDPIRSDGYWTFAPDYGYSNYNYYYPSYGNAYYNNYNYNSGYNSRYAYNEPSWLR